MTACTNHGGKARRVVTAALVGVLSVGTVPMAALATEVSDGIQTLVADWSTGAKVTEAEDGKGAAYTGDLTKPVSFDLGSGKYLVPTQVTNQNGDATDIIDAGLELTYEIATPAQTADSQNPDGTWNGLIAGGTYLIDGDSSKSVVAGTSTTDEFSAEFAASYFGGTLTDATTGKKAVHPVAGSYTVIVSGNGSSTPVELSFSLVDEDPYAGAYVYENNGVDTTDTDFVYTGYPLDLRIANADGTSMTMGVDYDNLTWYTAGGDDVTSEGAVKPGDYVVVATKDGETIMRLNFTIEKFDISKHGEVFGDIVGNMIDSTTPLTNENFLKAVTPSTQGYYIRYEITNIVAPSGTTAFDGSYGEYSVTVKSNGTDPNCIGEKTYVFSNLNEDIYNTLGLYYGASSVAGSTVNVNLTEGDTFDASKIKVRSKDGATVYSGDQLEVTYKKDGTTVDASALSKAGTYEVTVRVKPFQNADGDWVGGTRSFTVKVNGNVAYDTNVSFYVDGEVAGATEQLEYDGTDLLQRVSARVSNPEGGQFELGTDFVLEAKNSKGEVVESVVDAGEYTVSIKPLTFELDDTDPAAVYDFTLEVTPLQLDSLNDYTYAEGYKPFDSSDYVNHSDEAVAWTGSAVEVPGVQYKDAKGNYVTLDPSLYNVVSIKDESGKVVKEAVDEGTYTVRIALSDEAKSNYSLADREFTFRVKKYSPFDDVKSPAWYAQVVNTAKYTNVVNGISGTNMYAPDAEISRKDAVCIIFNMAGGDSWDGENDFTYSENGGWYTGFGDCDGNAYYAKALAWAHNLGIANGSNGSFRPDDRITREELASMLANYAKVTGDYVASDGSALAGMPDASSVSGWATENVAWAVENGVMGNGGSVNAGANITRAEVAAMAVNYAQKF